MSTKRYYWLKLKDDFFRDIKIKKLRKIAGGDTYTIIYLKMQLLSLQNEGVLTFEGVEDSFADEMALILDEEIENVKVTLMYLLKCGLLQEIDEKSYLLTETIKCIGSEGASAARVRHYRERHALQCNAETLQCNNDVTDVKQIGNGEKEKEKEIEKREKKKEKKKAGKPAPVRHKYGEYNNVLLSDEELEKLKTEFPNDWQIRIEQLSGYCESTGKSYKNYLATIRNWARREKTKPNKPAGGFVSGDLPF